MPPPPTLEPDPVQLDLFLDGAGAILVHAVVEALATERRDAFRAGLDRLRAHDVGHPDLPALERLGGAVLGDAPNPQSAEDVLALAADAEVLASLAERLAGPLAARILRPVWRRLVAGGTLTSPDRPDLAPAARHWLAVAHYHLGRRLDALPFWLSLCWLAPETFARHAPVLPDRGLREAWAAFRRQPGLDGMGDEDTERARWFAARILLDEPGLAHLLGSLTIPEDHEASRVLRCLLTLLPLERRGHSAALIAERRRLKETSPAFFALYLGTAGGRAPR